MAIDTVLNETDTFHFHNVPCPHCGYVETLDTGITGFWTCAECGGEFWITPLTLISSTPPRQERDKDGNVISVQISFGYLSLFPREYLESDHADDSNS